MFKASGDGVTGNGGVGGGGTREDCSIQLHKLEPIKHNGGGIITVRKREEKGDLKLNRGRPRTRVIGEGGTS